MQTHGSTAAEESILASEREFINRVVVDWNKNGLYDHDLSDVSEFVEYVGFDRSLKGSAPEEVLLIEGSAAAELTVTMNGTYAVGPLQDLSLPAVFSPYQRYSPFSGKSLVGSEIRWIVLVHTNSGVVEYQQFVGKIRTIVPNRAAGTVTITALDRSELLRRSVRMPPWAVSDQHINYGKTNSQLAYSHWVIDHCLRLCGVSPSPKRPTTPEEIGLAFGNNPLLKGGVMFWLTGNGSYLPTVGYVASPEAMSFPNDSTPMYSSNGPVHPDTPDDDPGPLALYPLNLPVTQVRNNPSHRGVLRYWALDRDDMFPDGAHYLGFTLNTSGPNASLFSTIGQVAMMELVIGRGRTIEIMIAAGKVWSRLYNWSNNTWVDSSQVTIPTGQTHVDIHVQWDTSVPSGSRVQVRAGDNTSGWEAAGSPVSSGSLPSLDHLEGRITLAHALSMSDVYYTFLGVNGSTTDRFSDCWRPAEYSAVLDRGINRFSTMPVLADEAWKIVTDVAAAEYGSVFWDEHGVFRFWNYDTMLAKQSDVVRSFGLDHVSGLSLAENIDSVRNLMTVSTRRRRSAYVGFVFESQDVDQFLTPPNSVKFFKLYQEEIQSPKSEQVTRFSSTTGSPVWNDDINHGHVLQFYTDAGGWVERDDLSQIGVKVYFSKDGFLTVRVDNIHPYPVRFGSGAGDDSQAAFRFSGVKIIQDATLSVVYRNSDSIVEFGPNNLTLEGDWYQEQFGANKILPKMLTRTAHPIPNTDAITVPGDPRLQLGDTVAIQDPEGLGQDIHVQILGVNREWRANEGLRDTLTVEVVRAPGQPDPEDPEDPEDPTPEPVTNVPLNLTATPNNSTLKIQLQWDDVPGATSYRIYSSYYRNGALVKADQMVGEVNVSESLRGPLSDNATYYYQVTSIVDGLESDRTPIAYAVLGTDSSGPPSPGTGGGSGGTTSSSPGVLLNIGSVPGQNHFNLGVGYSPGDDPQGTSGAVHRDSSQNLIETGLTIPGYFEPNAAKTAVLFKAHVNGGKTSANTQYPRTEMRELKEDGVSLAAWNGASGTHYMQGKSKVTHLPPTKPWVVFAQIHDASSDLIRLQTELVSGQLVVRSRYSPPGGGSEVTTTLIPSYTVGTEIDWKIEVINGSGKVFLNGAQVQTFNGSTSGCYFKAGAYAQTNSSIESDPNETCDVELRDFTCWHTGYATPSSPPDPGPGGGGSSGGGSSSGIVPSTATVIFQGDYNTGNFSQWNTIQNKVRNGSASGYDQSFYGAKVQDGGSGHATAARYEVRDGDIPNFGGGERSEVQTNTSSGPGVVHEGDERWYEFSFKYDTAGSLPSSNAGWFIIMQWHAGSGSPPLCFEVKSDGKLYLRNNALNWQLLVGDVDRGNWHDYILHAKFSNDQSVGYVEMWRDGTKVINKTFKKTMSTDHCYLKQGIYRDSNQTTTAIVWHDGLRVSQP